MTTASNLPWILPLIPFGWRPDQLVEHYIGPDANFSTRGLGVIVFLIFTVVIGWIATCILASRNISAANSFHVVAPEFVT